MPELPDVEVFRRRLAHSGLHKSIARVEVPDTTVLHGISRQRFSGALRSRQLTATGRHGKYLYAAIEGGGYLVLHFGMTGYLDPRDRTSPRVSHTRLALDYGDGSQMAYVDSRRLGKATVVDRLDDHVADEDLGPDALELSHADLRDVLRESRGTVKATLMDQSRMAGIGNIYSDEILFQARIGPKRKAAALDDTEVHRLHRQTRRVLGLAIDRKADPERLPDGWLLRHREDGAECPRGNGTVAYFKASGRGAYYCPTCQPASNG